MSRRQHVVRTEDQGGVGLSRSLGGSTILCAKSDCGSLGGGDGETTPEHITVISVESSVDYTRCVVAATVGWINAYVPSGCR
jgi:hypothetical protein